MPPSPESGTVTDAIQASVVQVRPDGAGGAGVVLERAGEFVIVTNAHVARAKVGTPILVVTRSGAVVETRVERIDLFRDLAVLAPSHGDGEQGRLRPAAVPGDISRLKPGHLVLAVGHPFGLANAISMGIVHSVGPLRGAFQLTDGRGQQPWIQADIRLAPGNSGGPLCDAEGRLIGLNTMIVNGLGLAVPIPDVIQFVQTSSASQYRGTAAPSGVI